MQLIQKPIAMLRGIKQQIGIEFHSFEAFLRPQEVNCFHEKINQYI